MSSDERPEGEPFHAARLKLGDRTSAREVVGAIDHIDAALDELHRDGFAKDESAAEEKAAQLRRLAADHAHIERLRADDFEGTRYDVFNATLAMYGEPVMRAWIRRRQIWELTAANGRAVRCPETVRDHLTRDLDDRCELAGETVAYTLEFFRERVLRPGKWSPDGGASLTTYFAGALVAVFPNVFRRWLREYKIGKGYAFLDFEQLNHLLDPRIGEGPEDRVIVNDMLRIAVDKATSDVLRRAVAYRAVLDRSYAEIAEAEGMSENAVKQMFYRYRQLGDGRTE
jgi:DNA-directed RNA polymerase specialized sigma24 family protein